MSQMLVSFGDMISSFFSAIPKLMYILATSFLTILDVFQLLVRKLAGLDTYYVNSGSSWGSDFTGQQSGDIVEEIITGIVTNKYPALNNVFWSFIILGVIILFVTTIIALIRNEYTPEKDGSNSKSKVLSRSFRSIITFAIVPITAMFGVYLCNVILRALDSVSSGQVATSMSLPTDKLHHEEIDTPSGKVSAWASYNLFSVQIYTTSTPFSGLVFKTGAYAGNRVRTTKGVNLAYGGSGTITGTTDFYALLNANQDGASNLGIFTGGANDHETVASMIDDAFANNVTLETPQTLNYPKGYINDNNLPAFDLITGIQTIALRGGHQVQVLDRYNTALVWYYYDLWNFNFVVAFGAGIVMLVVFINIIFGLMRRIIESVGLFLISPTLAAIMPLDDGSAFKTWSKKFIGKILGAYGAVVGLNLVMIILPYINAIRFFGIGFVDAVIDTLFIIVGLIIVKGFMKMLSDMIGADDAQSGGSEISKEVGQRAAQAVKMTAGAAAVGLGATGFVTKQALGLPGQVLAQQMADDQQAKNAQAQAQAGTGGASSLPTKSGGTISPTLKNAVNLAAGNNLKAAKGMTTQQYKTWKQAHPDEYDKELEEEKQKINQSLSSSSTSSGATSSGASSSTTPPQGYQGNPSTGWRYVAGNVGNKIKNSKVGQGVAKAGRAVGHAFAPLVNNITNSGLYKSTTSFFSMMGEPYKSSDFYKGWKDEGGLESVGYSARGISAGEVAKYKKLKEAYDTAKLQQEVAEMIKNDKKPKL